MIVRQCILLFVTVSAMACVSAQSFSEQVAKHRAAFTNNHRGEEGVKFACSMRRLVQIDKQMTRYLRSLKINPALVQRKLNRQSSNLIYTLVTPADDTSTLDFHLRPEMNISDQVVRLSTKEGESKEVQTVSEKEIVLALMQHGRLTEFSGKQCHADAFIDHVRLRQNTVAWAETLEWIWPDGEAAKWNEQYWNKGTPLRGISPAVALADTFHQQDKYAIGCYTATKLVMVQGAVDYYHRVKNSPYEALQLERRLLRDGEPLVGIEPRAFWSFEDDFEHHELWKPGKLLEMRYNIPAQNFVPGDWSYLLNTDPKTKNKTGYEGSNAIYLGRGKFDDYYNDNNHSYTLPEKLNEVFQWRNGVFNRTRDKDKIVPLTEAQLSALEETPDNGGLLMDTRVFFMTSFD